jgi:alkylhydroperoxidase/carboxymuconolactone decarboxylase family protein YurZ
MEESAREKAEELIARMKGDRGYIYPEWEFAARADPDFVQAYNELYRRALNDGQALSAKIREFVAIGILAFKGDVGGVRSHIQRAVRLGASTQEVLEAVESCIIPGGAPAFFCGLKALLETLEQEME